VDESKDCTGAIEQNDEGCQDDLATEPFHDDATAKLGGALAEAKAHLRQVLRRLGDDSRTG
jgi:hypothetical protein